MGSILFPLFCKEAFLRVVEGLTTNRRVKVRSPIPFPCLLLFTLKPYNLPMHSFTSFHSILQGLARSQGFDVRLWEYRLQTQWRDIVGDVLAVHTWPTRIRFRKLFIAVDNSVWLHQLMYLKSTLMEKIQSEAPDLYLRDIVFRIGEIPEQKWDEPESSPIEPHVSAESFMIATECTREVTNEELRYSLTQVISKALSSRP